MKRIAVITRAYNRLEYTIQCVTSVRENAGYDDYEHIVVSQGSTDGTIQWLDWITSMKNNWFSKVRALHPPKNLNDWGGMVYGAENTDAPWIIQLDNDMETPMKGWLYLLARMFTEVEDECLIINLKRGGVRQRMGGSRWKTLNIDGKEYHLNEGVRPAGGYIMKRETCLKYRDMKGRPDAMREFGRCLKTHDIPITQLEGYSLDGVHGSYIQHDKYGKGN